MEIGQGEATVGRLDTDRVGGRLAEGFSPAAQTAGLANYTFAFDDNEEVGPGLLAQIAKKTGLQPDDL